MSEGASAVQRIRLGINIDHVATIRNARGGVHPDPVRAARVAADAGADQITAHLREDRRHISDDDIRRLTTEIELPLNLEMAATAEMLDIALRHRPFAVCLVPEKRRELTTEGGLDVVAGTKDLKPMVERLKDAGIRVSLFIDPDLPQVRAAQAIGASVIEIHTGSYCDAKGTARDRELTRVRGAASEGCSIGLEVHAGHGLSYDSVGAIAAIPQIVELNIGHFLVGEAIFVGLQESIRKMRVAIDAARAPVMAGRA
ncbi:MAG: pyridoxine 5'-phosphate synthase [Gemmatimonas sp.]